MYLKARKLNWVLVEKKGRVLSMCKVGEGGGRGGY